MSKNYDSSTTQNYTHTQNKLKNEWLNILLLKKQECF